MSRRETLQRHALIVSFLRKCPASFTDVSKIFERESELKGYNFNISKRTFQRDCQDISLDLLVISPMSAGPDKYSLCYLHTAI